MSALILFFKAEQRDLFDAPVIVGPSVRKGKTVAAYTRIQKVAHDEPAAKHPVHIEVKAATEPAPNTAYEMKVDKPIHDLIAAGALFVINHSGGKDSQAMMIELLKVVPAKQMLVVHATLGDAEWPGALEMARDQAAAAGVPFLVASAAKSFWDMVEHRFKTRPDAPSFPSAKYRQCTSDLKRGPIEREVRRYMKERDMTKVVSCTGIRAQESAARAKIEPFAKHAGQSIAGRDWYNWAPIHDMKTTQVFATIAAAAQKPHWAYAAGNERLSCVFCIMGSKKDLQNGAKHNPELAKKVIALEKKTGYTMHMSRASLTDILAQSAAGADAAEERGEKPAEGCGWDTGEPEPENPPAPSKPRTWMEATPHPLAGDKEAAKLRRKEVMGIAKGIVAANPEGLTKDEAARFQAAVLEGDSLAYDRTPPSDLEIGNLAAKVTESPEARMSTLSPLVNSTIVLDTRRDKGIFMAMKAAVIGTHNDADTPVDDILKDKNPTISALQFYNNFAGTRDALRAEFGDSITLYRSPGKQRAKAFTNWATTEAYAKQYGAKVISKVVPIDHVLGAFALATGKYHELLVGTPPATLAKSLVLTKADQLTLFNAPVHVGPSVRNGKAVKPYTRVQRVAAPQADMFPKPKLLEGKPDYAVRHVIHGTPITPAKLLDQMDGESFCVSFADPRNIAKIIELQNPKGMLLLDNGAFSHWKQGKGQIDRNKFFEWANDIQHECPVAVAVIPDVIEGNEEQNWQEAAYAVHELSDFPERLAFCWHMNDSIEQLRRAATLFNVVAIGSCAEYDVQKNRPAYLERLREASMMLDYVEMTRGRRPWVHLMRGVAVLPEVIRFESADSTNVARNHTYSKGQPDHVKTMVARVNKKVRDAADEAPLGVAYPTTNFSKGLILFFKASKISEGARWITIHPNGPDEKGQPLMIQPNSDGSAHVIGGAGGSLNYLKLRNVRSVEDYAKDAEAKRVKKTAERKEKAKKDKEAGIYESKTKAKQNVRTQELNHEHDFVKTVADSLGWDKSKMVFPEEDFKGASEAAANKARDKFHRNLVQQAHAAVDDQRQHVLKDADARLTAGLHEVPVTSDDDNVITVKDLDPIPTNTAGLGFSTKYGERAKEAGMTAEEVTEQKEIRDKNKSPEQRAAMIKRGAVGKAVAEELKGLRDPAQKLQTGKADTSKAVELLKAQKKLKSAKKKARDARAEIDESEVEPKAYVIAADAEPTDESVEEDLSNDLRTINTRAFLSEYKKIGGGDDTLGKYIGIGAYNSVNALALAVSGDALVDRSVVDVLGISGAAQVLARRLQADLPEGQAKRVAEGMQEFHLNQYMQTSAKALEKAQAFMAEAAAMDVTDLSTAVDIKAAQEINKRHAEAILAAQTTIGEALGEMEGNAALTLALKRPGNKPFQVSLGKMAVEQGIAQVRALGLQRGDFTFEHTAGQLFLTVTPEGMNRLAKPINRADIEQVHRNLGIIAGDQDEDNWLPEGFANRPDLVMNVKPGVADRLAEPFTPGEDLEKSVRDYIGGRAADGDNPADIMGDLQSEDFVKKAGDPAAYEKALVAVAPLHGADGQRLRAEDMQPAFDKLADEFVSNRYGGTRSGINQQKFALDDNSADALHRALAETPAGVSAYKPIGELDHTDQRNLREFFHKEIAKENPEKRAALDKYLATTPEPERMSTDMFGDESESQEWQKWNTNKEQLSSAITEGGLTWDKYIGAMHGPEKAYEAMQDLIRSKVHKSFADAHNTLNPQSPLRVGRQTIRNNIAHLDMTDPVARAKRQEADRERIDALRERIQGRYAAGSVVDKLDAARAQEDAFKQSQMGFFASEDVPETKEQPLGGDERYSLGHIAERQIAGMMDKYGQGFDARQPVQMIQPNMSGPTNAPRQRLIKLMEANKRVVAAFGTGSGKTAIQLGAFSHLKSKGKANRGLFLVPSIVQGQFGGAALQFLKPGQFNWHIKPGASQAERIAAYKNPKHDFCAMTHSAFRDDMLHLGAKAAGISEGDMSEQLNAMAPEARKAWMKKIMTDEGINFDFLTVDEGQATLNRQGKENSALANVVDSLSAHTPYYMTASADTVKNDTSEIYDVFAKMDPERYKDRDAFMRRYGADTVGSKDALRREMARYMYPSKIDPDIKVDKKTVSSELSEGQRMALKEVDQHLASMYLANREGKVDVDAARAVSPASFEGEPPENHEKIAKDLQRNTGLLKSSAIQRIINTHPDNPAIDDLVKKAGERKGKPGVVFAHSLAAVKMLGERLEKAGHKVITITGSDSGQDKEKKRAAYQNGEADILVASDAAAVGMNVQRGQWCYQHDTPQTAMVHAQRQGRINRIGQKNDVELLDSVPNHPEIHKARDRLTKKYALRDMMTTPMEGLDETGVGKYLKDKSVMADEREAA